MIEGDRVEVVEEVDAGALGEAPGPRNRVILELRQGLAAEARTAGAEEHHVGGTVAQPGGRLAHILQVIGRARHVQQRQPPRGIVLGEPLHGTADDRQGRVERGLRDPVAPDIGREGEVDRLLQGHGALRLVTREAGH